MTKYARWFLIAAVMAAVGAGITTGVAFVSAMLADTAGWPLDYQFDGDDIVAFAAENPEAFARELIPIAESVYPADVVFGYSSWAVQGICWQSHKVGDEKFSEMIITNEPFVMLRLDRAGWPLRCLESTALSVIDRSAEARKQPDDAVYIDLYGDITFYKKQTRATGPAVITNGWVYESGSRIVVVPYGIMWPSFAANTAIFGGTPILAFGAVRLRRRSKRKRAGACLVCGYNLAGLGGRADDASIERERGELGENGAADRVCPECGEVNVG